ncbi:ABC transporter ATP-binding protein [Tissierella creatinophila]|uniref:Putative multidrug resistance ABC transporter ATP-binding/permease protein YheI n=1 Tax=Tissierella creatinophila DSM 6911 TaxID=1123403 RepID=A0A1U7M2T7_TISCR|nr:ABC transporter ATP-binding protein [Tissierella creatinophila]OLS01627.1 putative multidrug resistance ABC transporter ATP-binding/permease protein YheI [Tissierella creatinophila DSM 6911]
MFKKFWWFISYYKNKYILAFVFLALSNIVGLIPPYITGRLTDMIFEETIALNTFLIILGLDILVIVVKYFLAMGWSYFTFRAGNEIDYKIRDKLMTKILNQSMNFFEKNSTGSLMGKATNDVDSISNLAGIGTLSLFDSTVFPIIIIIMMMVVVDVKLTLASILPLPILAYLSIWIGEKILVRWYKVQRAFDSLNSNVLEDIEGIRIIRVFNLQDIRRRKFEENGKNLLDKNMEVVKYQALLTPVQRIIPAFTFIIGICYGAVLISRGEISIGKLISFTYYLNMLVWPMHAFGNFINFKQQANSSMDRIQEVLDYKEYITDSPESIDLNENQDIEFINHSFKYPTSREDVLKDLNIKIKKGKSIGVLGKTGSGKSTFIKQLLHLYPMNTESIYIDGKNIDKYTAESIREKIGYVPQKHMVFSKNIKDNIKLSKPNATDEEVMEAIRFADFEKDLKIFPKGLDTLCGEKGISLSGGQNQRISIARAILKNPDILILDDAMSAVDGKTEKNILRNIQKLKERKTMIISSHRISQVKDLDEIIVLDKGEIKERGTHEELIKKGNWYSKQYQNQSARSHFDEE